MSATMLAVCWGVVALAGLLALRLGRSAIAARSWPEGLIAMFFFGGGVVGYGALLLRPTFGLSTTQSQALRLVSEAGFLAPIICVAFFTWLVFRREAVWARAAAFMLSAAVIAAYGYSASLNLELGREAALHTESGLMAFWTATGLRAIGFGWACGESFAYYRKSRRQVGLGLVEPLVANRFLLWACWSGLTTVLLALRVVNTYLVDLGRTGPQAPTWLVLAQIAAGLPLACTIWLTFSPPAFYRHWVAGKPQPS